MFRNRAMDPSNNAKCKEFNFQPNGISAGPRIEAARSAAENSSIYIYKYITYQSLVTLVVLSSDVKACFSNDQYS